MSQHSLFLPLTPLQEESRSRSWPKAGGELPPGACQAGSRQSRCSEHRFTLNNSPGIGGTILNLPCQTPPPPSSLQGSIPRDNSFGVGAADHGGPAAQAASAPRLRHAGKAVRCTRAGNQPQTASPACSEHQKVKSGLKGSFGSSTTATAVLIGRMEPSAAQATRPHRFGDPGRRGGAHPHLFPRQGIPGAKGNRGGLRRDVPRPYGMVFLLQFFNLTVGSIT